MKFEDSSFNHFIDIKKGQNAIVHCSSDSPGAQKHLFHISSTKGLMAGIYAFMIGDAKKAITQIVN